MKRTQSTHWLSVAILIQALVWPAFAHEHVEDMASAANNFLAALDPEQKKKAVFAWKDEERFNWHFIPRARKGLGFNEMTTSQGQLAHGLLNSAMSHAGYVKALTIMSLEQVLFELEKRPHRDAELYYFSIFGQPAAEGTWGWRVEGHHLSLNFTIVNGEQVFVTPSFFGANPAEVRTGPRKGLRVMAREEDLGRKLVQSLSAEQRKIAIYTDVAPRDIITGADRKARFLEPAGLPKSEMNDQQAELLERLLKEYVYRYRAEIADQDLAKIKEAGPEKIFFAWAGSVEPNQGHYYRIQGPTFLVEYDNTQNNANHIHAVWRDLENDFGDDVLRRHYEQHPHN